MKKCSGFSILFAPVIAAVVLLYCCSCHRHSEKNTTALQSIHILLPDTLSLEQACKTLSMQLAQQPADTVDFQKFYTTLDYVADSLQNHFGCRTKTTDGAQAIVSTVYATWHITFNPDDTVFTTLLPDRVYNNKQGMCLSTGLLILLLAERLQCPVYGVMLPGHFFCRYDNDTVRFNIEPNKNGMNHDNAYYRSRYTISDTAEYSLQNLTTPEVIGLLCYNAGTICMRHGQNATARALFKESQRRLPNFTEAQGNYACAFAQAGETDSSLLIFESLFSRHSQLGNLALNYGLVALQAKRYSLADSVFTIGLKHFPNDPALQNGLSAVRKALHP